MFFIPLGIWCGAPFGVGYYIWKSMIPTALGNIVGGGLFVGTAYWYLYLTDTDSVEIDFNIGSLNTAMEAGGPIYANRHPHTQQVAHLSSDENAGVIVGTKPHHLPHSGGQLMSGLGKELHDGSLYAKSHKERTRSPVESGEEKA